MTNIISNSFVVIDVDTNGGGAMSGMFSSNAIFAGVAAILAVVVSVAILFVWLKKSK